MKKFALLLTLITAFSTLTLANTETQKGVTSAPKDSMGMMSAFMGTSESSSTDVGGGEVSTPTSSSVVTSTVSTVISNNNVTVSTPYSYK